jgi:hypothetical protein
MEALAAAHDAAVQMIDTSIVRVHQHGARGPSEVGTLQRIVGRYGRRFVTSDEPWNVPKPLGDPVNLLLHPIIQFVPHRGAGFAIVNQYRRRRLLPLRYHRP